MKKLIPLILYALLFALPLALDNNCYYVGYVKNFIFYSSCIWLFYLSRWQEEQINNPDFSVLLFFSWGLLSYLFHPYKLSNPLEEIILFTCYLMVYIAVRDYLTLKAMRRCLEGVVYVIFSLFIYKFCTNWEYRELYYWKYGIMGFKANFGITTIMACWLVMVLPLLLTGKRLVAYFIGVFLLYCTGSRAGVIGFAFSHFALLLYYTKRRWLKICYSLCFFICFCVGVYFYLPKAQETERISYWKSAVEMVMRHPVAGYGTGSFRLYYPLYRSPYVNEHYGTLHVDLWHAHNTFLEMGAELGIIGIVLFLFMVWRHFKIGNNIALIAGIFGMLCSTMVDVSFYFVPVAFMFWAYLGTLKGAKND